MSVFKCPKKYGRTLFRKAEFTFCININSWKDKLRYNGSGTEAKWTE